jgi:two-component system sensor histidine kinase BaeS
MEAVSDRELLPLLLDPRGSIPAIVVRDGVISSCSDAARDVLEGDVGRPVDSLFDSGSRAKLAAALSQAPTFCEVQARRREGEPSAMRLAIIPLGMGEHLLLVLRATAEYSERMTQQLLAANDRLANLTRELARQSAELEAARSRFESLANLREHFVSMLAHDVRGALQGIMLSAAAIDQTDPAGSTDLVREAVERIRRGAKRIDDLVGSVLEAARTETGRIVLEVRPISLRAIADEAIDLYAPVAQRAGVELALVDRTSDALVSGDRVRLGQVVGNLIENAIRHCPRGATVTVRVEETPAKVRIVVTDQGRGVPSELRDRVFERFVQGSGTSGSLGLGLFVARQLVELHGGRIYLDDVVPHGAAFTIELPRTG